MEFMRTVMVSALLAGGGVTLGQAPATRPAPATTMAAVEKAKSEIVETSQEEQLARGLLMLKAEQAAAAAKYGPADGRVRDLDAQISAMREEIGASSGAFENGTASGEELAAGANFARIVPGLGEDVIGDLEAATWAGGVAMPEAESAATRDAREKLEKEVTLAFDGQGLGMFLESLAAQADMKLSVNWEALKEANVERSTPISLRIVSVPAGRALTAALSQASSTRLAYTVDEGMVTVSTKEDLESSKYQTVRVFDIRDMLANAGRYTAEIDMREEQVTTIMDTIKSVVAPDSWRDTGGTIGSIRELNGQLIVNQTADNQRLVARLLARLRER